MPIALGVRSQPLQDRPETLMRKTSLLSSRSTRRRAVKLADVKCAHRQAALSGRHDARIDPLFTMSDNTRPPAFGRTAFVHDGRGFLLQLP